MVATADARQDPLAHACATTLLVLWTTYGSFYFCRVNIGPAVVALKSDLALSALAIGVVLGTVKLGYAMGQLVNGQLTERFGARRILGIGMVGSACATLAFAAAPSLAGAPGIGPIASSLAGVLAAFGLGTSGEAGVPSVLAVMLPLAFANGWFQAGGWPPCVKIAGDWFPLERRGRVMGVLGTSYTIGSAVAIFFVGALLTRFGGGWRIAFLVPPVVLLASFAHMRLRLREHPPTFDPDARIAPGAPQQASVAAAARMPVSVALRATLGNPRVWILALGLYGVDAVRYGFLDWAPGHLAEVQQSSALSSALKAGVFPLAGAAGTLCSGWLTDRFFQSRRAPVCALLMAIVCGLTLTYRVAVGLGAVPTVIVLALVGFCLFGAQILLVGTAAQDFARRGATAAAAGFVDFMGHVGAFSGDVVTGWALRRHGWGGAILWWAFAALLSAVLVSTLWRARPHEAHSG